MNWHYLVARIAQAVLTVFAVVTLSFVLIRVMPGGPVEYLRGQLITQYPDYDMERINEMLELYLEIHPEKPLMEAYLDYIGSLARGDLGESLLFSQPVASLIADALPWTIFYASVGLFLSFGIGILIGALMAYWEGEWIDSTGTMVGIVLSSIPYYVVGIALLAVLGFQLELFPTSGRMDNSTTPGLNLPFLLGALHHAALPIASTVLTGWGGTALAMRGNAVSVLGEDYLHVAQLRGLSPTRIATRYVGRNAILPLYTSLMISIGVIIGGSVILEEIFRYSGVGLLLFQAIEARDVPLMMNSFLLITVVVVIGIFLADLTYGYIDPRAGSAAERESYSQIASLSGIVVAVKRWVRDLGASPDDTVVGSRPGDLPFEITYEGTEIQSSRVRAFADRTMAAAKVVWSDWRTRVGAVIVSVYVLMGTVGVMVVPTTQQYAEPYSVPPFQNWAYPLGTDPLGQDLLAMVVHATPPMLKMLLAGAVFTTVMATLVGTFSGYVGGFLDRALMTVTDIAMTVPGLPLIIVLALFVEPSNPYVIGILLTVNAWAGLARTIRSEVISIREYAYVEQARLMGMPVGDILRRDVIRNILSYVFVNFVSAGRGVIFGSVALYFLGILPYTRLNWGVILQQAYNQGALISLSKLYWLVIPMVVISLLSIGLILIAQGMDRLFNVRLQARHADDGGESQVALE